MSNSENETIANMLTRRSIRKYKLDMLPKETIDEIIKAGTFAASGMNKQPSIIVAVTNKELRDRLSAMNAKKSEKLELNLDAIAEHSSIRERAAAEAERATVDLKKAEYMAGHIGEEFDGVISGVTAFGMFIELANGVEGLVHNSSQKDEKKEEGESEA